MIYSDMASGVFLSRPNRFIAHIEIDGQKEIVHVKNTGRCRELLPAVLSYTNPGAPVFSRYHK